MPNPKMLMEACKLTKSVTLRDGGNILTDILARLSFKAKKRDDDAIHSLLSQALKELGTIGRDLQAVNLKRMDNDLFGMVWQNPYGMQASLNI